MKKNPKPAPRRMGPAGSANWTAMLDAAEETLREEGYAALTSRRVGERVGVKQRLVYYYFQTMDDLIIEAFRRLSVREMARLRSAVAAERPLRNVWDVCIHTTDARLISEFMALANRIQGLRVEVIRFIEESRALQVKALTAALKRKPKLRVPPAGLAMLATSVALALVREAELGVNAGHNEIMATIDDLLAEIEPD
jgi:AcrR family transcriptional regulator